MNDVDTPQQACPFCAVSDQRALRAENEFAIAFFDLYPVSPGHTLITPRRHVANWFSCTREEQIAVLDLAVALQPDADGCNLGVNIGRAGGQTVGHVHLHLIPRHDGDVSDPRGGVRWVVPQHAVYWDL
jgi:diadenosine tetraphosphate (Ap4A) HIT family hydrolase